MCRRVLMRRVTFLTCAAMACLVAASFCGTAQAVQLWYDGFTYGPGGDYTVGESGTPDLAGQSGGTGTFFSGPWAAAGYPASPPDNVKVFDDNLSRPGFAATAGGSAANTPHFGGCCFESRTSRLMDSPWAGPSNPDGTFYVGYLMDFGNGVSADPHHRVLEMHEGGFDDGLNRNLMLGFSSFVPGFPADRTMALAVRDSSIDVTTTIPLAESATLADANVQDVHWMVLKFELSNSGNDVISAFLDPVGATEPTPSAQISVGEFLADRISSLVQFSYTGGGPAPNSNVDDNTTGFFDEIYVGTEWADVNLNTRGFRGVPEPGSLALLGLGFVGLGSILRRKRA
jgi:PEP-CTERM motif-containing protein